MMKDENFKLLGVLIYDGQTDGQTNERTFAIVELLSRLKISNRQTFKKNYLPYVLSELLWCYLELKRRKISRVSVIVPCTKLCNCGATHITTVIQDRIRKSINQDFI